VGTRNRRELFVDPDRGDGANKWEARELRLATAPREPDIKYSYIDFYNDRYINYNRYANYNRARCTYIGSDRCIRSPDFSGQKLVETGGPTEPVGSRGGSV
jgi:hypothetical protein